MYKWALPSHQAVNGVGWALEFAPDGWPGLAVPNFSNWKPGDIVLVGKDESFQSRTTSTLQRTHRKSFEMGENYWTHAALYIGNGEIVEVDFKAGLVRSSVWKYCHSRTLSLRRVPDVDISQQDRQAAVDWALQHIGTPYGKFHLLWTSLISKNQAISPRKFYCSSLVASAFEFGGSLSLYGDTSMLPPYPATLAAHPGLEDVLLQWRTPAKQFSLLF